MNTLLRTPDVAPVEPPVIDCQFIPCRPAIPIG